VQKPQKPGFIVTEGGAPLSMAMKPGFCLQQKRKNEMETLIENQNVNRPERDVFANMRQLVEGMTLTFNPQAAGDLRATIEFIITAPQAGNYWLEIAGGACTFHIGKAISPTLTITTASDVWLDIANGKLNPQQALMQGRYKAGGDFGLLLRMSVLFKPADGLVLDAPRHVRPGGPLVISGMTWLTVAFAPTVLYWLTFSLPIDPWVKIGLPLVLALGIVVYRVTYDHPTWLEIGVVLFFLGIAVLKLLAIPGLERWGTALGSLAMAVIWLSSLLFAEMPVSAEYSKWTVISAMWRLSLFLHPNAVISLMWGWQFIAAGALGMAAIWLPDLRLPLMLAQYGLIVPAMLFTTRYQKGARSRRIADVDQALAQIRWLAAIGLVVVVTMTAVTWMWL
jgi:putative sterol carrier protein